MACFKPFSGIYFLIMDNKTYIRRLNMDDESFAKVLSIIDRHIDALKSLRDTDPEFSKQLDDDYFISEYEKISKKGHKYLEGKSPTEKK